MAEQRYKINRVLNNNVLLVEDFDKGRERILTGKGIGFKKKAGEEVSFSDESIEHCFIKFDEKLKSDYMKLIDGIDKKVLEVCTEIILMAKEAFGEVNNRLHIVLTDHISFAIERVRMGMEIENPFLYEIQALYPEEFKVGTAARDRIAEVTGVRFNDDEVGFITLHLFAARQNKDVKDTVKNTRILKELVKIIEEELNYRVESGLTYNRLINHLRGLLERAEQGITLENPLLPTLHREFSDSFEIARKIRKKIHSDLGYDIPDGELGYMTIHIDRIWRMSKMKN